MGIGSSSIEMENTITLKSTGSAEEIKSGINDLINQEDVVIFSKSYCPYCSDAKTIFQKMSKKYSVIELNKHPQGDEIQSVLHEMTGARTVPRVFIKGNCVGGCSETMELQKNGALQKMIN